MLDKPQYTLRELFDNLPCTLVELGDKAGLNEVTVARIRDGKSARRATVNKLLIALSKIYGRPLSLGNVTGVSITGDMRSGGVDAEDDVEYPPAA